VGPFETQEIAWVQVSRPACSLIVACHVLMPMLHLALFGGMFHTLQCEALVQCLTVQTPML
jgi:hypothetical protein